MRAAIARSAKRQAGAGRLWRCARRSSKTTPIRSAASWSTARRAAATRESAHASPRSGARLDRRRRDPAWRRMADGIAALCLENSSILRPERCASFLPPTGRRRRASRGASASPATITNGHFCSIAGRGSPARTSRGGARGSSHLPILTGSTPARRSDQRRAARWQRHDPVARLWAQAERIRAYLADRLRRR